MPSNQYRLPGMDERLVVSWEGDWEDISVTLGNQVVGHTRGGAPMLRRGRQFALADGSRLSLKLTDGRGPDALLVRRNGRPLLAERGRNAQTISRAVAVLYMVSLINLGLGLVSMINGGRYEAMGIAGAGSAVSGGALLVLAVLFQRQRSLAPLVAAIAVYVLDGVFGYAAVVQQGGDPGLIGYVARAWFLYYLVQAAMLLREHGREQRDAAARPGRSP